MTASVPCNVAATCITQSIHEATISGNKTSSVCAKPRRSPWLSAELNCGKSLTRGMRPSDVAHPDLLTLSPDISPSLTSTPCTEEVGQNLPTLLLSVSVSLWARHPERPPRLGIGLGLGSLLELV